MLKDQAIHKIKQQCEIKGIDFDKLWWQQDGASVHRSRAIVDSSHSEFGHRVIALGSDIEWPPHSPDLTLPDYWFWNHLKRLLDAHDPKNHDELVLAAAQVSDAVNLDDIRRATLDFLPRLGSLKEADGKHFEYKFKAYKKQDSTWKTPTKPRLYLSKLRVP